MGQKEDVYYRGQDSGQHIRGINAKTQVGLDVECLQVVFSRGQVRDVLDPSNQPRSNPCDSCGVVDQCTVQHAA